MHGSYGEGLETDRPSDTAPVPYPTTVFKALKQTAKVKSFLGTSANAVKT